MLELSTGQNLGLVGKMLISTPYIDMGPCFSKSVIVILVDDEQGTLGVIVNRVITSLKTDFLYNALDIKDFPKDFRESVHFGGPVESEKGLILHTNDYKKAPLLENENGLCLSSNVDIFNDIANGKGPGNSMFALGYVGWVPNQLENEIKRNNWIITPYSHNLVFGKNYDEKWNVAINSIGFSPAHFVSTFGTA